MRPWLPPVIRGKIPTTPGRLLLAAAAMLALDLIFHHELGVRLFGLNFWQVVVLIIVLLFSPRRWVACLLMLPACFGFISITPPPEPWARLWDLAGGIIPPLAGVLIAYPRPRIRWVEVEEDESDGTDEKED